MYNNTFIDEEIINILKRSGMEQDNAVDLLVGVTHKVETDKSWNEGEN